MDKLKVDKNSNLPVTLFIIFLVCIFLCMLSFNITTLVALDNSKMINAHCVCKNDKCVCNVNYRDSTYNNYEYIEDFENSQYESSQYSKQLTFTKFNTAPSVISIISYSVGGVTPFFI